MLHHALIFCVTHTEKKKEKPGALHLESQISCSSLQPTSSGQL
jgi:hypothetical protein